VGEARKCGADGALRESVENNYRREHSFDPVRNPPVLQRYAPRTLRDSIETLQAVAARCKRFTPLVGIDPDVFPQSVLLDITRVIDLFGGEAALVQRIAGELPAEGWQFHIAVADTPGAAWALAWYGKSGKWEVGSEEVGGERRRERVEYSVLSTEYGSPSLAPLPLSTSPLSTPHSPLSLLPLPALRLAEPIVALLHSLGIWRIGELAALPRRELSSRFGPELLDCLDRVTGRLAEPLPAWDPPPQFEVCWSAEYPTARRETIEAALEHLVRRLAAMLTRAARGAMRLECRLTCLGGGETLRGETLDVAVGLFRPTAWASHLLQLLQVRLESLQLPGAVEAIRLTAVTAPLELRQQEMFERSTRVQSYHLAGLIDRLSNRLGHTRVVRIRLIPDAQPELACHYAPLVGARSTGFSRKRNSFPPKGGTTSARPLRLLTEPMRLSNELEQRIVRRIGPERIETGWWRGGVPAQRVGVARDYYRVETAAGCWFWIFRRLPDGPWFLHGMFD